MPCSAPAVLSRFMPRRRLYSQLSILPYELELDVCLLPSGVRGGWAQGAGGARGPCPGQAGTEVECAYVRPNAVYTDGLGACVQVEGCTKCGGGVSWRRMGMGNGREAVLIEQNSQQWEGGREGGRMAMFHVRFHLGC